MCRGKSAASACTQAEKARSAAILAVECKYKSAALVSAALARAKARPELNAFITLDEAGAMKAAQAYDATRGRRARAPCKPLGGVPIAIKDNIEVAGLPASFGAFDTPPFGGDPNAG